MEKEKANLSQLATDWCRITIDRWRKQLRKRNIGQSEQLYKSFVSNIIRNSDGDPRKIELSFLYYGRFVDMGVGRGVNVSASVDDKKLRGRAEAFKNARQPKRWYSPTLGAETKVLAQLLSKEFGLKGINVVEESILSMNNESTKLTI